jgi:ribosome-associated protein
VNLNSLYPELGWAVEAAQEKQAVDITVLHLKDLGAFAEYFLLCTALSTPQMQAIASEIEQQLARNGVRLAHSEGRNSDEWMLLDYGSLVVHIFSQRARVFYDLERLWRSAKRVDIPPPGPQAAAGGSRRP